MNKNHQIMEKKVLQCVRFLKEDPVRYCNLINFINDYPINLIDREGSSMMIKGKSDKEWVYIASDSKDELIALVRRNLSGSTCYAILEDWMLPYITKRKNITEKLSCIKLIYPQNAIIPEIPNLDKEANFRNLIDKDVNTIFRNSDYKEFTSIDYIQERIHKGVGFGIEIKQELVAWILTHDDGAIGFLTVKKAFRNKGYAYHLTIEVVRRIRCLGGIPFVHIEETNMKSMNLALKTGFIKERRIHWLCVEQDLTFDKVGT